MDIEEHVTFSDHFGISPEVLDELGVFDPYLTVDTPLAIDPKLLDAAPEEELAGAHQKVLDRFADVFALVQLSKRRDDMAWRAALKLLDFSEFRGVSLGTSQVSANGSGWGPIISSQVLQSASEIAAAGLTNPRFFELLALFEAGVGADRIGDMLGTILLPELAAYTERICTHLGIKLSEWRIKKINCHLPTWIDESGRRHYVMLVPLSILSDLPVGLDRSQVQYVADKNAAARDFLNQAIGEDWRREIVRSRSPETKRATRSAFFRNVGYFRQFIEHYERQVPKKYDFEKDPRALRLYREVLKSAALDLPKVTLPESPSADDVYEAVKQIVLHFKQLTEQNRLAKVFFVGDKPRPESIAQAVFQGIASAHCRYNNFDISPESNAGRGPVDFKFSFGSDAKVLVEMKLSQSTQLLHGYEQQLKAYEAAETTHRSIYLVIDTGFGRSTLATLLERDAEAKNAGKRGPEIIVADATPKPSASKA